MSSRSQSRLRKQSRLWCGHCNEYLSRAAFWKHRKAHCNVHSERWTTIKDDAENVEQEAKRGKYDPEFHGEPDLSDSSGDEDLETAIFNRGSTQVDDCEDSFNLGDDVDFLSAMNDDKEGNKSDEVDFQCYTYIVILNLTQTCKAHTSVTKLICNHWCKLLHCTCKSCNTSVL